MFWAGISIEGGTDRLVNNTLTDIRYWDHISGSVVRPYTGARSIYSSVHLSHHQVTLNVFQELGIVLVQTWEGIPRTPSVVLLGPCPSVVRQTLESRQGLYKLLSTILSCCNQISAKQTCLPHHFFYYIFGVSLNSTIFRLLI